MEKVERSGSGARSAASAAAEKFVPSGTKAPSAAEDTAPSAAAQLPQPLLPQEAEESEAEHVSTTAQAARASSPGERGPPQPSTPASEQRAAVAASTQ